MRETVSELCIISLEIYETLVVKKLRPKIMYCHHVWRFESIVCGKNLSSIILETRGNGLLPNDRSNVLQSMPWEPFEQSLRGLLLWKISSPLVPPSLNTF